MKWGGRLQTHSQWDNNSESGFDSQMIVLKGARRRIEPRHMQTSDSHAILKLFLYPSGNMIFLHPHPHNSSWNTGQPCNCSVNLSCRATPLIPILQFFNHRQILFKAEMIHHEAEFTITIWWKQELKKPVVMLFSLSDRLPCNSFDCSYNLLPTSSFISPQQ